MSSPTRSSMMMGSVAAGPVAAAERVYLDHGDMRVFVPHCSEQARGGSAFCGPLRS